MEKHELTIPNEGFVLIAGRPGMGTTYVAFELLHQMVRDGKKAIMLSTDVEVSHATIHYKDGQEQTTISKLERIKKAYPDISCVVEDGAIYYSPHSWETLLTDIIEHEHPEVVFINRIILPREKLETELALFFQRFAKEKHILILSEICVHRAVERRNDKHPKLKDVKCSWLAMKYVDQVIFVYRRDAYQYNGEGEQEKSIEVYSDDCKTTMSFPEEEII